MLHLKLTKSSLVAQITDEKVNKMTVNTVIGKISASKRTLNTIAIALNDGSIFNRQRNFDLIADDFKTASKQIIEELNNIGFYD